MPIIYCPEVALIVLIQVWEKHIATEVDWVGGLWSSFSACSLLISKAKGFNFKGSSSWKQNVS